MLGSKLCGWAIEAWADGQFEKMKTTFVNHGYGVVIGEYGAMARSLGSAALNAIFEAYRKYYMQYVTRSIERHGLVPMYWDGGLFNRSTGAHTSPDIIGAIIDTNNVGPVAGVQQTSSTPTKFFLQQNYPNPFNPSTLIVYQLPASAFVVLRVSDVLGREVETLVSERQNAGSYTVQFNASNLPSGLYFYELQAGTYRDTKKLLLLRGWWRQMQSIKQTKSLTFFLQMS